MRNAADNSILLDNSFHYPRHIPLLRTRALVILDHVGRVFFLAKTNNVFLCFKVLLCFNVVLCYCVIMCYNVLLCYLPQTAADR